MSLIDTFDAFFARCPLVAILRGVKPDEVEQIGEALVEAGFTLIEVPLNSPDPLLSIERLAKRFDGRAMIGAGTVLTAGQVDQVVTAGGQMIISPNADPEVITRSVAAGVVSLPGVITPSEAFGALKAGATALKMFPAESAGPSVLKAWKAVLPTHVRLLPVGGITPDTLAIWSAAGAAGFGLGSALYQPAFSPADILQRARHFVEALPQGKNRTL